MLFPQFFLDDRWVLDIRSYFQVDCSRSYLSVSSRSYAPSGSEPFLQGHVGLHQADMEVRKNAWFL